MLNIEMLPAGHGDCLWVEYGRAESPSRILIDGGIVGTYNLLRERILQLPEDNRHFELLVITHVDGDHIEGIVKLLNDPHLGASYGEVWFNGWRHLPDLAKDKLGPKHGEYLTSQLRDRDEKWNIAFGGEAVVVPDGGELPTHELPGGMRLTLLSPTPLQLGRLRSVWNKAVVEAKLVAGDSDKAAAMLEEDKKFRPKALDRLGARFNVEQLAKVEFDPDPAPANGSSIVVLAEYEGKSCLLAGDAHAPVLADSIGRLLKERGKLKLKLDAFKLAHHGSMRNTSPDLMKLLDCRKYLFSTNGNIFGHPDAECVARVLKFGGEELTLCFNYNSMTTGVWDRRELKDDYGYKAVYPDAGSAGLLIKL